MMKPPGRYLARTWLALVFLFLYVPIASVVVFSFNESPLVSVWTGFSLRWYEALLRDRELTSAAWISLALALATAFASVALGAWIGFVMASYRRFRGQALFMAMVSAPMVLPEVVSGIALLLLFVGMTDFFGWPAGRGMLTMWIGHVMLCISYVAITVQARLSAMDHSLVEAAKDLGATPLRVFYDITLPLIAQALVAGWLLSFTISLDDVIMSAFLSGPQTTTLPLVILSRVRLGLDPVVNALGTLFVGAVSVVLLAHTWYLMKRERVQRTRQTAPPSTPGAEAQRPAPAT